MNVPFLDLGRQVASLRDALDESVRAVLDGGRFVGGAQVEQFEDAFAAFCGARHAVGVASGTNAITIALQASGIEPGDEVITAANTCVPTVAGVEASGARVVLADVDPVTLTLDPDSVEHALTEKTRAVVPVHLYGGCAPMDELNELARKHNLVVVEDAAQAAGARYRGASVGALGTAAAFSFYPTKNLGALGDAGAVVTSDDSIAERARLLRSYGERDRYDSLVPGTNSRLDTVQAAWLSAKLPFVDSWRERRATLARCYEDALRDSALTLPSERADTTHAWHLYVIRADQRDAVRRALAGRGVETLVHYPQAVHEHTAYRRLGRPGALDVSEQASAQVISLPLYPELSDAEAEHVAAAAIAAARA